MSADDGRSVLTGWGRTGPTAATIRRPRTVEELNNLLSAPAPRGAVARGLGRSYGDAAQNAGGDVVDIAGLPSQVRLDPDARTVRVGAGVSLDHLMRRLLACGMFLPVTPGTRQVTVGGAIAADIHGKNHHQAGSFAMHVDSLHLHTPTGAHEIGPTSDPELFWATAGGMGLTGVVSEATLRVRRVESAWMRVDTERAACIDDALERLTSADARYEYSVAWIDCLATGSSLGRSVLTWGEHATAAEVPGRPAGNPLELGATTRRRVPGLLGGGVLRLATARAFNELWFRCAPRRETGRIVPLAKFFHPLDSVGGWNQLYGRRGFVQYQFVVPLGSECVLRVVLERLSHSGISSFLGVLKRLGAAAPAPMSFPLAGWTLALDIPVGNQGLGILLDELDDLIADAGGRIYLAKDSRLAPGVLRRMYPRLDEWCAVRRRVDPDGRLRSDLARRLGI